MTQDFDDYTDDDMSNVARHAFSLGLKHGRTRAKPLTGHQLWQILGLASTARRKVHRTKVRQVYGAGFDIGESQQRLARAA